jgi:broad specificity phosphatase PhoE
MNLPLKNKYFLLRHGKNIHQTEKSDIVYFYPDDNPPCELIEEGVEEIKKAGEILKNKKIDLMFCSDVLRTRQTAKIISEIINFDINNIIYDLRLRDINWGVFGGKSKSEAWNFYNKETIKKFETAPPQGESWDGCLKRMSQVLEEIERNFNNKNVLIVSHGDPLWLLEGCVRGLSKEALAKQREEEGTLSTGEIREL